MKRRGYADVGPGYGKVEVLKGVVIADVNSRTEEGWATAPPTIT
jgi:hypothetical protein